MTSNAYKSIAAVALAFGVSFGAYGQGTQGFYKSKQLHMIVGYEAGNDYDEQFNELSTTGTSVLDAYWQMVTRDIEDALRILFVLENGDDGLERHDFLPRCEAQLVSTETLSAAVRFRLA